MGDWEKNIHEVVNCCAKFDVRVDQHVVKRFQRSSVNVSLIINVIVMLQRPMFFKELSGLFTDDPIRLDIEVWGEIFKVSLRCLNILCKIIAKPGIGMINILIKQYGMAEMPQAIQLLRGSGASQYKNSVSIGCESPLPNIGAMYFIIAIQKPLSHETNMYKCRAEYKQIVKLIDKFEKMHSDTKEIINVITFVDRYPVLVLLNGRQILYRQHQEPPLTYVIPLIRTCTHGKICTRPFCTYLHRDSCKLLCRAYCSPAHISHYHNDDQSLVMDSLRYVYNLSSDGSDPEIESICQARTKMAEAEKNSFTTHTMDSNGNLTRESDDLFMSKRRRVD